MVVLQAGVAPPQWVALVEVQATQVLVVASHAGVGFAQLESVKHATQIPALTLQYGVGAAHCPSAVHEVVWVPPSEPDELPDELPEVEPDELPEVEPEAASSSPLLLPVVLEPDAAPDSEPDAAPDPEPDAAPDPEPPSPSPLPPFEVEPPHPTPIPMPTATTRQSPAPVLRMFMTSPPESRARDQPDVARIQRHLTVSGLIEGWRYTPPSEGSGDVGGSNSLQAGSSRCFA